MTPPENVASLWDVPFGDHGKFLTRFIANRTGGRGIGVQSPADMANEVWVRVVRKYPTPPTYELAGMRALLVVCAKRLIAEFAKKKDTRAIGGTSSGNDGGEIFDTLKGGSSPERGANIVERVRLVREALMRLTPSEREIVDMRCHDQLTFLDIGRRLRVSDDCARKRFEAASGRLARELRRHLGPQDLSSSVTWTGVQ